MIDTVLDKLRIATKLYLLSGFALLLAVIFSVQKISTLTDQADNLVVTQDATQIVPAFSDVIHELQRERGVSAGFIGSRANPEFKRRLVERQAATDAAIKILRASPYLSEFKDTNEKFAKAYLAVEGLFARLAGYRRSVEGLSFTVPQMAASITPVIRSLFTTSYTLLDNVDNIQVAQHFTAILALMEMKERAGIERAMGAAGFGGGSFAPALYTKYAGLQGQQLAFEADIRSYAKKGWEDSFTQTLEGPELKEVKRLRIIARDSLASGDTQGIAGSVWFDASTAYIDALKKLENQYLVELGDDALALAAAADSDRFWEMVRSVIFIMLLILVAGGVARNITGRLSELQDATYKISVGETDTEVPHQEVKGAIGRFANMIEQFRANLIETVQLREQAAEEERHRLKAAAKAAEVEAEAQEQVALERKRNEVERGAAISATILSLSNEVEQSIADAITGISQSVALSVSSAGELAQIADEVSVSTSEANRLTQSSRDNAMAVQAAAEELATSIHSITGTMTTSSDIVDDAATKAEGASATAAKLESAAQSIQDVVSIINDISEQTNLLALNATIEAARAGEAGKGFAVVASEVKSLANQTAASTDEIGNSIETMRDIVNSVLNDIRSIGQGTASVREAFTEIDNVTSEQAAATQDISTQITRATESIGEASEQVNSITQGAENVGQRARELEEISAAVRYEVEALQDAVKMSLEESINEVLKRTASAEL